MNDERITAKACMQAANDGPTLVLVDLMPIIDRLIALEFALKDAKRANAEMLIRKTDKNR